MQPLPPPHRQPINLETWPRRTLFDLFNNFIEPYHGVCIRLDCTATFHHAKQHRHSVFLSLVHRSLVAANQVDNLHTRIVDDCVWRYEIINAGSAVGRPNGTIGFGYYPFHTSLDDFVQQGSLELERVRQRTDIERSGEPNLIRYSVLPWFDFTSISHARDFNRKDSAPLITFGKISESRGRCTLPVSVHVHHALADGSHVAEFIEKFQAALHSPDARQEDLPGSLAESG